MKLQFNQDYFGNPEELLNTGDPVERAKLIRYLYNHYVSLRYIARGNGCNKASFMVVYDKLQEPDVFKRVHDTFGYSKEEMNYRLKLAKEYIPMIK